MRELLFTPDSVYGGGGDGWGINKNKKVARTQLRGVPGWLHGEGYNGYGLIPPPLG